MQLIYGGVSYTPAPIKTQPIVVPPAPVAPTVPAIGTPSIPGESVGAPTGIHAILTTVVHPVMSVGGIQEIPQPTSFAAQPISGIDEGGAIPLNVSSVTTPVPSIAFAAPQLATVPAPSTGNEYYLLIAAVVAFLYFMLRKEGV